MEVRSIHIKPHTTDSAVGNRSSAAPGWVGVGDLVQGSATTLGGGGARVFIYGGWMCAGSNTTCDTYVVLKDAWELCAFYKRACAYLCSEKIEQCVPFLRATSYFHHARLVDVQIFS